MHNPIFSDMRAQMEPSQTTRSALEERRTRAAPPRKRLSHARYWALAACAALVVAA